MTPPQSRRCSIVRQPATHDLMVIPSAALYGSNGSIRLKNEESQFSARLSTQLDPSFSSAIARCSRAKLTARTVSHCSSGNRFPDGRSEMTRSASSLPCRRTTGCLSNLALETPAIFSPLRIPTMSAFQRLCMLVSRLSSATLSSVPPGSRLAARCNGSCASPIK